jgi:Domain of unknown function (DUF4920)
MPSYTLSRARRGGSACLVWLELAETHSGGRRSPVDAMLRPMRAFAVLLNAALLVTLSACSRENRPSPTPPPSDPRPAATALGQPIAGSPVALAEVAKNPGAFEGKPIVTSGTVTAVCQHMGCWMEIADAESQAHVRMHGHSFFVPRSANGKHARVQATLVPAEDPKDCDEKGPGGLAKVELDATGVEID